MRLEVVLGVLLSSACLCCGDGTLVLNLKDTTKYNNCEDVLRGGYYRDSGSYIVFLNSTEPLEVYCRFEHGRAATSIMQQKYGHENFQRMWSDYENGFGSSARGDFWLGLRQMKRLTDAGYHILTVTLQDWSNVIKTIQYNYFVLGPSSQGYPLSIGDYMSQNVLIDDFSHNNHMRFSTMDRPDARGCASSHRAGWWYNYCTYALPTGRYYFGGPYTPSGSAYDGIFYSDWHGFGYSLRYIRMDLHHF